jgi:choline dehydrogenase-like flavoprotein
MVLLRPWLFFVRSMTTTDHHIAGTCRMGEGPDPMIVVDSKLRVRGLRNLR